MQFKVPYLLAMRDQAPKMFRELSRHGRLEQHLQQKSQEAHGLLEQFLQHNPNPSLAERREAEERVFAELVNFPPEKSDPQMLEPPDDLEGQKDQGRRPGEYQALMAKVDRDSHQPALRK